MIKKKEKRGGARKGAGAKKQYSEPTKTFSVRCPESKVDELKLIIRTNLNGWKYERD